MSKGLTWGAVVVAFAVTACGGNGRGIGGVDGGGDGSAGESGAAGAGGSAGTAGAGAAAGTGGSGGATQGCTNSRDCDAATGRGVCDPSTGLCVACLDVPDCPPSHDCTAHACVPYQSCANSRDCTPGTVCDTARGRCVQCVDSPDCGDEQRCVGNVCRAACVSDRQCLDAGLLCDKAGGYCVTCVGSTDCQPQDYCDQGDCKPDVCAAGTERCASGAVEVCAADGSGYTRRQSCGARQSCVASAGTAYCADWACTPDVITCNPTTEVLSQCSSDGLDLVTLEACAATGQVCVGGECKPRVCTPSARFCENGAIRTCSAKGDTSTLLSVCKATEYCDDSTTPVSCRALLCTPSQPTCDGNLRTTCNASGTGYTGPKTDCGSQLCLDGACQSLLCAPNRVYCDGNEVWACSSDGLTSARQRVCGASEYCAESGATASCVPRVCTPNQPTCDGNASTTCNAEGSGYTGPKVDCGTQSCVAGSCTSSLFVEDFEYGNFARWSLLTGTYASRTVISTGGGAEQSSYYLRLVRPASGTGGFDDGLGHVFSTPIKPRSVSFWMRANATDKFGGCVSLFGDATGLSDVFWVYFSTSGIFSTRPSLSRAATYVANRWYHWELRNLDWSTGTFDVYLDGTLRLSQGRVGAGVQSLQSIMLSSYDTSSTGDFDQFDLR